MDPIAELGIDRKRVLGVDMTTLVKETLKDSGMSPAAVLKCKNMFALGLICWLFDKPVDAVLRKLQAKFAKKPAVYEANAKVVQAGWDCGHNTHSSMPTYRVESDHQRPGVYTDVSGNTATAWGLIMASQRSGRPLFLGSYPITPATDILHELAKRKDLGVKACQLEDEIAGVCSAIGASFAGNMAVTSTSGPGLALKSEGIGLAVIMELPLVVIDVQRGGPFTGLPTKTEQTDLAQALYGRNGESPIPVLAAASPTDCFDMAFEAARIAMEHMTPVILLTDAFIANGSRLAHTRGRRISRHQPATADRRQHPRGLAPLHAPGREPRPLLGHPRPQGRPAPRRRPREGPRDLRHHHRPAHARGHGPRPCRQGKGHRT